MRWWLRMCWLLRIGRIHVPRITYRPNSCPASGFLFPGHEWADCCVWAESMPRVGLPLSRTRVVATTSRRSHPSLFMAHKSKSKSMLRFSWWPWVFREVPKNYSRNFYYLSWGGKWAATIMQSIIRNNLATFPSQLSPQRCSINTWNFHYLGSDIDYLYSFSILCSIYAKTLFQEIHPIDLWNDFVLGWSNSRLLALWALN